MEINLPIAVFDSGIGSYSIVKVLREELPNEKIIYLADRGSFPYGTKTRDELLRIIEKSVLWLEKNYQPKLIILASNTPSIQVLEEIKKYHNTKLIGTFPPLEEAVGKSKTKHIAILATKGAVTSPEIEGFIKQKNLSPNIVIHKVDAADLVALVEQGIFQTEKQKTETAIKSLLEPLLKQDPHIDVMTLSSTHLPFLYGQLSELYPGVIFINPAHEVVAETKRILKHMNALSEKKRGTIKVLATESQDKKLKSKDLRKILHVLGLDTEIEIVTI